MLRFFAILFPLLLFTSSCKKKSEAKTEAAKVLQQQAQALLQVSQAEPPLAKIPVQRVVSIAGFFKYIDDVVTQNDTLKAYKLSENLLLRANPWILDTLVHTDYYYQMARGNFVYEQQQMTVLKPGDTLVIPGPLTAAALLQKMANTRLDVNIPGFELRILEGDSVLYRMPVRVGKNKKKFLDLAGHTVDLRTHTGKGEIIRVNRYPLFIDPVTGKKFKYTKRDDHRTTLMPQIPWLEPEINGMRYGQMIHPTTNPRSLGKPASNGCIGVREEDAWRIYFYAPVGTPLEIRYDLQTIDIKGDTIQYDDLYKLRRSYKNAGAMAVGGIGLGQTGGICLCDSLF
jgi:lipoprotein-anchoring transpeptidase ErfK/SrfK